MRLLSVGGSSHRVSWAADLRHACSWLQTTGMAGMQTLTEQCPTTFAIRRPVSAARACAGMSMHIHIADGMSTYNTSADGVSIHIRIADGISIQIGIADGMSVHIW